MKIEIALHRQGECHTCSTELSLKKVDLATEYIERISSQPQKFSHQSLGLADKLVSVFCFFKCHKHQIWSHVCTVNFVQHFGYDPPLKYCQISMHDKDLMDTAN